MNKTKLINLARAVATLEKALSTPVTEERDLAGIIKSFEYSYELAWTTLKATLEAQGQESQGPRDVIKRSWQIGLLKIATERVWLKMIEDRNLTVHTYDEIFAREMAKRIQEDYLPAFLALKEFLENLGA